MNTYFGDEDKNEFLLQESDKIIKFAPYCHP